MDQVDILPPGGRARLDVGVGRELQMLALTPRDDFPIVALRYLKTPAASSAAYSASPMPTMPRNTSSVCWPSVGPAVNGP